MIPLPTRSILFPYTTLFRSHHAVRIVAKGYVGVGQEVRRYALIQRRPARTGVGGLEDSADGYRDVQMPGIARVHENRVQEFSVRSGEGCPFGPHRVVVEPGDRLPALAAVARAEESRR